MVVEVSMQTYLITGVIVAAVVLILGALTGWK